MNQMLMTYARTIPTLPPNPDSAAAALAMSYQVDPQPVYLNDLWDLVARWTVSMPGHSPGLMYGLPMDEVMSEAIWCLQRAALQFDPAKGTFLAYYINKLRGCLSAKVRKQVESTDDLLEFVGDEKQGFGFDDMDMIQDIRRQLTGSPLDRMVSAHIDCWLEERPPSVSVIMSKAGVKSAVALELWPMLGGRIAELRM